jgi:hypothetical protein
VSEAKVSEFGQIHFCRHFSRNHDLHTVMEGKVLVGPLPEEKVLDVLVGL